MIDLPLIDLSVRGRARTLPRAERQKLLRRLTRAMSAAGESASELSLSLVDDDEIQLLNREWRHEDKPTDVLSFSQTEGDLPTSPSDNLPGLPTTLGDIVISVETAQKQATETARPLDAELLHLAVHGLAHLLGYDHATPSEEHIMFTWETQLREQSLKKGKVTVIPRP